MPNVTRIPLALAALALLAIPLAGCSSAPPSHSSSAATSSPAARSYAQWNDALESCMKDAGFDDSGPIALTEANTKAHDAAQKKCTDRVGPPPAQENAPPPTEQNAAILALIACLRKAGYTVSDPKPNPDGSLGLSLDGDYPDADFNRCSKEAGLGGTTQVDSVGP
jgi:hypothetical protein